VKDPRLALAYFYFGFSFPLSLVYDNSNFFCLLCPLFCSMCSCFPGIVIMCRPSYPYFCFAICWDGSLSFRLRGRFVYSVVIIP
jgi:hypothetical protein